jgi:acetyl-CoA carboxylase carboxyltransferase component
MGPKARPGDGVVGAAGRVAGRPVFCYAQDAGYMGGSLGAAHADTIVRCLRLAGQAGVPVVGFIESGGARMQEGLAALGGYGRIFYEHVALSGRVPQISVITGTSAGGGSYAPALTDFVTMTERAVMFLTGPAVVRNALGEDCSASDLGGHRVHDRNGVCHFVVPSDLDGAVHARKLLGYLPQRAGVPAPLGQAADPEPGDPAEPVPTEARCVYDVRDVIRRIVDRGSLLEVAARWARNMVCAFARLDGRPVGVIANQPHYLGGIIDVEASQKGAGFVRRCDALGIPLVVLVDTPGFMPGRRQETAGVIRHGASLLHAFAGATVPRLTVVLRKAYGGAYITMNSKDLGAHLAFAWPTAEVGVMAAGSAVGIIHRRELADAEDHESTRRELADNYAEEHLRPRVAAGEGFIDEVIAPTDTRDRLCWGLACLGDRPSTYHPAGIP